MPRPRSVNLDGAGRRVDRDVELGLQARLLGLVDALSITSLTINSACSRPCGWLLHCGEQPEDTCIRSVI
jgi:hypothetical protein